MSIVGYYPILTQQERSMPFYISTIGISQNEQKVMRPDGMEDYQLLYCVKGEGVTFISGGEKTISPGTGFILPPQTPHDYYAVKEPWTTYWVTFNGTAAAQVIDCVASVFTITHMALLDSLFQDIFTLPRDNFWSDRSSVQLYKLLIELKKCIKNDTSGSIYELQLQLRPVIDFMRLHFSKPVELRELAALIHRSPAHFCRLFMQAYNMRPFEYITRLRLQKAKELLASRSDLSAFEIGELVGYANASYFSALFKKQEKMTPACFRSLHTHHFA